MPGFWDCYDQARQWIGENHKTLAAAIGGIVITIKVAPILKEKISNYKSQRAL